MRETNKKGNTHKQRKWLGWVIHTAGWLPLMILLTATLTGNLGFNPVEEAQRWTGRLAVTFLLFSLACTPAHKVFVLPRVYRLRKPLGLYAALYAGLHFAAFALWDYRLELDLIWREISSKPFIILGLFSLIILLVLAATSFRTLRRKLPKAWVWLHRLVYVAGILAVFHYLLAIKGDFFSLQGNYTAPLIATGVLTLLFLLRIPKINQTLRRLVERK